MGVGWWAESGAWVPRDWALRPSYDTRVAIINALYACGENVQRLMPIMLAEAVRRDRFCAQQGILPTSCLPATCEHLSLLSTSKRKSRD